MNKTARIRPKEEERKKEKEPTKKHKKYIQMQRSTQKFH